MNKSITALYRLILHYVKDRIRRKLLLEATFEISKRLLLKYDDEENVKRVLELGRFRSGIRPVQCDQPEADNILIYAAHQDDEIIGAGGTFIRCRIAGKRLKTIYVTDGAARNKSTNQEDHAVIRRAEAEKVWKFIGGEPPEFWDMQCRKIAVTEENASIMRDQIEQSGAECVFLPFFLEPPLDHRRVSQLLALAYRIRPLPDTLQIWSYQVSAIICANVVVDITELIDKKNEANEMWFSQNVAFNYAHFAMGMAAYNSIYLPKEHKPYPQKRYAEVFFVSNAPEYCDFVNSYFGVA